MALHVQLPVLYVCSLVSEILLTAGTIQEILTSQHSIPTMGLGVPVASTDHQLKGPLSFEGNNVGMGDTASAAITRNTTTKHNSWMQTKMEPAFHLPAAGQVA